MLSRNFDMLLFILSYFPISTITKYKYILAPLPPTVALNVVVLASVTNALVPAPTVAAAINAPTVVLIVFI